MSAGHVITQIRRDAGRHDFLPAYSTDELLRGVCHITPIPKELETKKIRAKKCNQALSAKSRAKFETNKQAIYEMIRVRGRGLWFTAKEFSISPNLLRRYLNEEESK